MKIELKGINLSRKKLVGIGLSNANLSYANLSYADLSYADLSYADLSYANLSYANLSNANLSNANLFYSKYNEYTKGLSDEQKTRMINGDKK